MKIVPYEPKNNSSAFHRPKIIIRVISHTSNNPINIVNNPASMYVSKKESELRKSTAQRLHSGKGRKSEIITAHAWQNTDIIYAQHLRWGRLEISTN